MANSAQIKTGWNALQQQHLSERLRNTLFNRMPLLYFLLGRDGQMQGGSGNVGLGRPKTGVFVSGVETAKARKESILGASEYAPIIQTSGPAITDGKAMGMYDTVPQRANWDTVPTSSYFTRPRVKWCEVSDPWKVANKEIRRTTSAAANELAAWKAVGSLFTAEQVSVMATHEKRWNQMLWGSGKPPNTTTTGAPDDEDATVWNNIHSLQKAIGTLTNTYCGVDRTVAANAYWKPPDTSGYTGGPDFETLIDYCNYDLSLSAKGEGINLLLVDGTNFKRAKREAKVKGFNLIHQGQDIPNIGRFGFKRELVMIDNTWIVYDPECPSGHVAALNLDTFTFAIHPAANFKLSPGKDQSEIEGGDDAMWGTLRTEILLVCELPSLNAYFTGLT